MAICVTLIWLLQPLIVTCLVWMNRGLCIWPQHKSFVGQIVSQYVFFFDPRDFVSCMELLFKFCDYCDLCWSQCFDLQDFVSGTELLFQVCET